MLTRRTVITFEKLERCIYRLPTTEPVLERCDGCGHDVSWINLSQTIALTGFSLREIFRRIEANTVHFEETAAGEIHICPNSLGLK